MNLLVLTGYQGGDKLDELAAALAELLEIPVQTAFLEGSPSAGESLQAGVLAHQPRYGIVLPVLAGVNEAKLKNLAAIVDAANERGFEMVAHYGGTPGTHPGVVDAYYDRLMQVMPADASDTALLVVGRGSRDARPNADIYTMARLLYERVKCDSVDVAFCGLTSPDIATGIRRSGQTGARRIIIVPYVLYDAQTAAAIQRQVEQIRPLYPEIALCVTADLEVHPGMIQALECRYHEALSALKAGLSPDGHYIPKPHSHGPNGSHTHAVPDFLPPRYQGDMTVSAAPMGAADLIFDKNGRVAWDEIWGGFCDLALAGGPPHRGTLLEPVAPEFVRANYDRYRAVLAEIERGIDMITGLPVVMSAAPGWIGMRCTDEAMALWLLRAIVVENICVRREDDVLFFPAGPDFRLAHEIKNIITVIAKTHHYWTEHLQSQGKDRAR